MTVNQIIQNTEYQVERLYLITDDYSLQYTMNP